MLPQMAVPPTTQMIYAIADNSFDVTAAMAAFYATENAPTIESAVAYLRKYARVDAHTLTLYLTYRANVHIARVDLITRGVTWGGRIAFGSMQIADLLQYSLRVNLDNMTLDKIFQDEDDSEEIPDLPDDVGELAAPRNLTIDNTPPYVNLTGDDYEVDSAAKKFIAQVRAQAADLLANRPVDQL